MVVHIKFDSIWQNSFLEDGDTQKRKFIATSKAKGQDLFRPITENTILGVLSRLIGDQRPLRLARESGDFYFDDIATKISHQIKLSHGNSENAMLINKSENRPAQGTFIGVVSEDTELFFSSTSPLLWSVIYLSKDDVLSFILGDGYFNHLGDSKPLSTIKQMEEISNMSTIKLQEDELKEIGEKIDKELKKKKVNLDLIEALELQRKDIESKKMTTYYDNVHHALLTLKDKFPNAKSFENNEISPINLYVAALYIQAERMVNAGLDLSYCQNNEGEIAIHGFAKGSLNFNGVRDFLNKFAGGKKKTSKTPVEINKASGQLEIIIDISREKAKELEQLIENAGVSSFYLGKKGLAHVTHIDTREVG
jgi:hypothetical protein